VGRVKISFSIFFCKIRIWPPREITPRAAGPCGVWTRVDAITRSALLTRTRLAISQTLGAGIRSGDAVCAENGGLKKTFYLKKYQNVRLCDTCDATFAGGGHMRGWGWVGGWVSLAHCNEPEAWRPPPRVSRRASSPATGAWRGWLMSWASQWGRTACGCR
jgi:hypothetical protein